MSKSAFKNLIRKTYNDLASENNDPITKYGLHGVNVTLAQLFFLAHPSPQSAVDVVVEQLKAELAKLQDKEIPREKWHRFFQDEHWVEKTYQRYGLPYQAKANSLPCEPVKPAENAPIASKISHEAKYNTGSKWIALSAGVDNIPKKAPYCGSPVRSDGFGTVLGEEQE